MIYSLDAIMKKVEARECKACRNLCNQNTDMLNIDTHQFEVFINNTLPSTTWSSWLPSSLLVCHTRPRHWKKIWKNDIRLWWSTHIQSNSHSVAYLLSPTLHTGWDQHGIITSRYTKHDSSACLSGINYLFVYLSAIRYFLEWPKVMVKLNSEHLILYFNECVRLNMSVHRPC